MSEPHKMTRRKFFQTSGLIGAAALLPTGRSSGGLLLKHLVPEEELIPGNIYWLTSTCNECPAGCGVNVGLIDANATKIEGNEQDPINHGGLCARGQSALENLYSPARVHTPMRKSNSGGFEDVGWDEALQYISQAQKKGKVAIVGRQITGAMRSMINDLQSQLPDLQYFVYEPFDYASIATANKLCFGMDSVPVLAFDQAKLIVSFGADFLETWISPVAYAYGYSRTRTPDQKRMSRFVQFESHLSMTGANADDRFSIAPGSELVVALALASELLKGSSLASDEITQWRAVLEPFTIEKAAGASGVQQEVLRNVLSLLKSEKPSVVMAGGPPSRSKNATALQIAVNLINAAAGNYGKTITFDRIEQSPLGTYREFAALIEDMEGGGVSAVIVYDTVPEFALPSPERYQKALANVPLKIKLATVKDDTLSSYDMVLPALDWLETWDLVEPRSGIKSLRQPIIQPFTRGRHPGQVLADVVLAWTKDTAQPPFDYDRFVQNQWEQVRQESETSKSFEDFWKVVLNQGGVWLEPQKREVKLDAEAAQHLRGLSSSVPAEGKQTLLPIMTVRYGDGRQTGRLWLNELPDPITIIVWDDPLLISPATAEQWKCKSGDVIKLSVGENKFQAPVHVQPGMHDLVAAMPLGTASKQYAPFHSYENGNPLHALSGEMDELSGALVWTGAPLSFGGVVGKIQLAQVQGSFEQGERRIAQAISLKDVGKPEKERTESLPPEKYELYPKYEYPNHFWGMVIDLSLCTGCGACAVACQAENNVYVVGKKQCLMGRQLSWLRIERFRDQDHTVFLPMLCQQCEHAPCEYVCPVYASVHNNEGLNLQVYNRCVGTRYCANNCPYKVRHFNWFTYSYEYPLSLQFNPRISLRTRGIMEKCTFCIQRIREQEELAKIQDRPLQEGEIVPACAQSCPTRAITFGDLKNPDGIVSRGFQSPRGYQVLKELNTQPSVTYLKRAYHPESVLSKEVIEAPHEQ